jgi:hypothetical protein
MFMADIGKDARKNTAATISPTDTAAARVDMIGQRLDGAFIMK